MITLASLDVTTDKCLSTQNRMLRTTELKMEEIDINYAHTIPKDNKLDICQTNENQYTIHLKLFARTNVYMPWMFFISGYIRFYSCRVCAFYPYLFRHYNLSFSLYITARCGHFYLFNATIFTNSFIIIFFIPIISPTPIHL